MGIVIVTEVFLCVTGPVWGGLPPMDIVIGDEVFLCMTEPVWGAGHSGELVYLAFKLWRLC